MDPPDPRGTLLFRLQRTRNSKTTSTSSRFSVLVATVVAAALPLSFIFHSIHVGHSRRSVYLLQVLLAVGLLEKSWWHYRIRQRFLAPLETSLAALFGGSDPESSRSDSTQYRRMLREKMEPKGYAITAVTDKWMKGVCGAPLISTLALTVTGTAAAVGIAWACEPTVAVSAAVGALFGILCACFAPTTSDGIAILIHEGALTVTAMNTMIAHYSGSEANTQILDYLFVSLAGWILIAISRIVACKNLVECSLMVTLDTIALLHLTVIMMELVDFVEHPLANKLPEELAAFFITVGSAELGHFIFNLAVAECVSRCLWRRNFTKICNALDFVVSVCVGAVSIIAWMEHGRTTTMGVWHVITLLAAAVLSQLGRSFINLIHETAMAPPWTQATFTVWNNGTMELMNPFLIGWIAFHPYAKTLLESKGGY